MGYSTDFDGRFKFDRQLDDKLYNELIKFNATRHNKGDQGADSWTTPDGIPSLYCQWIPDNTGLELMWDGKEKFYEYVGWLKWLIDNKFKPNNYKLNGRVFWRGEQRDDIGTIEVKDNDIYVTKGQIIYEAARTVKI